LNLDEAEFRTGSPVSREASQNSVRWAREKGVPVNDAVIGAAMVEMADPINAVDEDHFGKLQEYDVRILNPTEL